MVMGFQQPMTVMIPMEVQQLAADADCDGVQTIDDCDDTDATSTVVVNDADCDGVLTADDCDDNDARMFLWWRL